MHGSRDGSFRGSRSADVSQHNFFAEAATSTTSGGRRSRDGSAAGGSGVDPDDSGKRVRKDGDTLSKTLSVAGQQAVELTMRYLAHVLLRGEGPFQVHEVVWMIHKAYLNLIRREIPIPHLSSQFLTSVVLRGLLMKQQMGISVPVSACLASVSLSACLCRCIAAYQCVSRRRTTHVFPAKKGRKGKTSPLPRPTKRFDCENVHIVYSIERVGDRTPGVDI